MQQWQWLPRERRDEPAYRSSPELTTFFEALVEHLDRGQRVQWIQTFISLGAGWLLSTFITPVGAARFLHMVWR